MSVRIHHQLSLQCCRVEPTETQAALEQPPVDGILQSARQMLPRDERLDGACHEALFVHVDQRFKVHGRRKWWESIEHLGMCWSRKVAGHGLDAHQLCRCRRINQVR